MTKRLFYILYFVIQCTWGFLQTLVGLFFFIAHTRCPHNFYRGCIETHWNSKYSGLSLGLFIFTPEINHNAVRVHEYGHTFQSLVLDHYTCYQEPFQYAGDVWHTLSASVKKKICPIRHAS